MDHESRAGEVVPVILAGGDSRRMGYPKALLPLGDRIFVTAILEKLALAGLENSIVVLGRDAPLIQPRIDGYGARIMVNPDPDRGQLSSIQIGISELPAGTEGCLIWPVDQPQVSHGLVAQLVRLFLDSRAPVVAPTCAGRKGHPTIFHRSLFQELMLAPLAGGAKPVVQSHMGRAELLPTEEMAVFEDMDTPEDYSRLTGLSMNRFQRPDCLRPGSSRD